MQPTDHGESDSGIWYVVRVNERARTALTSDLVGACVDNLYLDMNGIIHNCSHPNDGDAHFRISEDKMFLDMFNYIDHLFSKIKPKKVFFLAIDGK